MSSREPAGHVALVGDPRRPRWERLESLLDRVRVRKGPGLTSKEVRELTGLYRSASSDLLEELRRDEDSATSEYLRALVGRAHGLLHRGAPPSIWKMIVRFFLHDFPDTVRRRLLPFAAMAALFFGGTLFGAAAYTLDPGTGEVLLPFGHREMDASERVEREESTGGNAAQTALVGPLFAAQLFAHNSKVTYLCFALAVTGGIGIVLLVFANGAYIGAVGAKYVLDGEAVFFAAWVGPHGVVEIPAILLGATAGLVLAKALFLPGVQGRAAAMQTAGKDAVTLLIGATVTLLLAGAIEGTFSQLHAPVLPYGVKIAFACILTAVYWGYLLLWSPRGGARRARWRDLIAGLRRGTGRA